MYRINERIISQELNYLLPDERYQKIRKRLKKETLILITDEIERIKKKDSADG